MFEWASWAVAPRRRFVTVALLCRARGPVGCVRVLLLRLGGGAVVVVAVAAAARGVLLLSLLLVPLLMLAALVPNELLLALDVARRWQPVEHPQVRKQCLHVLAVAGQARHGVAQQHEVFQLLERRQRAQVRQLADEVAAQVQYLHKHHRVRRK